MATQPRHTIPSVAESLIQDAFDFEFHQVIKILEQMYPNFTPIGEGVVPSDEAATIKSRISLSSPSSDIFSLEQTDPQQPPTLNINFWGLAGLQGPIPAPYTELIIERMSQKDFALKDFLDIFNHRLVSLLHRIRKKYTPALNTLKPHQTLIGQCLTSLTGTATQNTQETLGIHPHSLVFYAGLLWQQSRSSAGLKHLLSHYFAVPVAIRQFQGQWVPLESSQLTTIGKSGQFDSLGQGAMLGKKVWNHGARITIQVGPMNQTTFKRFLKTGDAHTPLLQLLKLYLPPHQKADINLVMQGKDVLETKLDGGSQLGWTTWLNPKEKEADDDQVRLFPTL